MKNVIIVTLLSTFMISSCKKETSVIKNNVNQAEAVDTFVKRKAVIVGPDLTTTICSGGYMINFTNNTKPYGDSFYQWSPDTNSYGIIYGTSKFPMYVEIEARVPSKLCSISLGWIEIKSLTKL
jgi:hypothetical protein